MKQLTAYLVGNSYKLKWIGGGEIPTSLSGVYTASHVALAAGQEYLDKRRPKAGEKSAKS